MSNQLRAKYPSGRPSALEEIFKLIREEIDWNPSIVDVSTLKNLGIAPSKESPTVQTLKFLGILLIFEKRKSINQTKPNGYPVDMQTIGFVRSVFVQYLCKHSIAARICHGVLFLQCVPSFASR